MNTERQPTCEELVEQAWQSRREDLRLMLDPQPEDVELVDDGTLDTVLQIGEHTFRYEQDHAADYRDEEGELFKERLVLDEFDNILFTLQEAFDEYGLSFDYVAPGTFEDQERGYFRYQISWGGPSQELRFYVDDSYRPYHIEFWHLDWFDGACEDVTNDEVAQLVWQQFEDFAQDVKERDDV